MNSLNNENIKKNHWHWLPYLLILLTFFLIIGFYIKSIVAPFSNSQMAEITDTWTYFSQDDPETVFQSQHLQKLPNIDPDEVMVMERQMVRKSAHPEILIQGNHQWMKVFLDNEQFFEYSPADTHLIDGKNPGKLLTEIQMPKEYVGKTLSIEIATPYQKYAGLPPRVFLGEANSLMSYVFSVSLTQILIFILAVSIGVTVLGFVGRKLWQGEKLHLRLILFGCFAITVGMEAAAGDIVSGLLFSPSVNSTLANVLATLVPLLLTAYYCSRMEAVQRPYRMWVSMHISISLLILAIAVFTKRDLPELMSFIDAMNVFSTLAASLACIAEVIHKTRFFVICTPWIILIAIAHCFLYISDIVGANNHTINWSGLFFVIILLVITVYTVLEFIGGNEENKRQIHFLEIKTALLEENRTTLIQHLKEVEHLRLEFKKNLLALKQLGGEGQTEAVTEYIQQLLEDAKDFEGLQTFSEHSLTNLLLARFQKLADQKSITTHFQVALPETLAIPDEDLTQLFAHLFEHALRETYAINDPKKRQINLNVSYEQEVLQISCEHTAHYHKNIFDKGITTDLPEKETFDLWMIESVLRKYAGTLDKKQTEKTDRLDILLSA